MSAVINGRQPKNCTSAFSGTQAATAQQPVIARIIDKVQISQNDARLPVRWSFACRPGQRSPASILALAQLPFHFLLDAAFKLFPMLL